MRSNDVLGFIFAGTLDDKIPELAASRTTASVPIGGKYRLIDFVLSNMVNSPLLLCPKVCSTLVSLHSITAILHPLTCLKI